MYGLARRSNGNILVMYGIQVVVCVVLAVDYDNRFDINRIQSNDILLIDRSFSNITVT